MAIEMTEGVELFEGRGEEWRTLKTVSKLEEVNDSSK